MKHRFMRPVILTIATLLAGGLAAAPLQASTVPGWRITQTLGPNITIYGMAATSPANAWAVGNTLTGDVGGPLVVRHWNGTVWDPISIPALFDKSGDGYEPVVAGTSATDMWTAGYVPAGNINSHAYLLHWNGSAWNRQIELAGKDSNVVSIVAVSPSDYWAFGYSDSVSKRWHFDGKSWTELASPSSQAESASAYKGSVWALGSNASGSSLVLQRLSGKNWVTVKVPLAGVSPGSFVSADAIQVDGPDNVYLLADVNGIWTDIIHYDGHTWSRPHPDVSLSLYNLVASDGNGGVWVIGSLGVNYAYHYSLATNRWSTASFPDLDPYAVQWIPGTQSVWGGGQLYSSPYHGVIVKYGD
jgi:hypothetical protein